MTAEQKKSILVVEDEMINALLLKRLLKNAGYNVTVANNGSEAIQVLGKETFHAVLTDWMMPEVDGIELIKYIRRNVAPPPYIILITALVAENSRNYSLSSGADDFIQKPIDVDDMLLKLNEGLQRYEQKAPEIPVIKYENSKNIKTPPHICVAIASSTGGLPALLYIFKNLEWKNNAAFLIVQHGPIWMLETFSERLKRESNMPVHLVNRSMEIIPGNIYLAPGEKHIVVDKDNHTIHPNDGPKENFVKPSAEPLFRSVAEAYGKYAVCVVLTGLGRDGAYGAAKIAESKGVVLVQDPATAIAPSMPNTVLESGIPCRKIPHDDLPKVISETVFPLAANLKRAQM